MLGWELCRQGQMAGLLCGGARAASDPVDTPRRCRAMSCTASLLRTCRMGATCGSSWPGGGPWPQHYRSVPRAARCEPLAAHCLRQGRIGYAAEPEVLVGLPDWGAGWPGPGCSLRRSCRLGGLPWAAHGGSGGRRALLAARGEGGSVAAAAKRLVLGALLRPLARPWPPAAPSRSTAGEGSDVPHSPGVAGSKESRVATAAAAALRLRRHATAPCAAVNWTYAGILASKHWMIWSARSGTWRSAAMRCHRLAEESLGGCLRCFAIAPLLPGSTSRASAALRRARWRLAGRPLVSPAMGSLKQVKCRDRCEAGAPHDQREESSFGRLACGCSHPGGCDQDVHAPGDLGAPVCRDSVEGCASAFSSARSWYERGPPGGFDVSGGGGGCAWQPSPPPLAQGEPPEPPRPPDWASGGRPPTPHLLLQRLLWSPCTEGIAAVRGQEALLLGRRRRRDCALLVRWPRV